MPAFADLTQLLLVLTLIAFLTETILTLFKTYLIKFKMYEEITMAISMLIGVVLAFVFGASLFTVDNPAAYYIGVVVCGLIASRGSNYVHNFFDNLPRKF